MASANGEQLTDAAVTAEGEQREGGRRRRRGGRGRGEREEGQVTPEGQNAGSDANEAVEGERQDTPRTDAADEGEGGNRRRRGRGDRDRSGRDRGERNEGGNEVAAEASVAAEPAAQADGAALSLSLPAPSADTGPFTLATPAATPEVAPTPDPVSPVAQPQAETAVVEAPVAPVAVAEPFVLPIDELQAIAQSAGLSWVNSDADKIRAVQEAIAQEPKPVHVPRERKPAVVLDEGPLILVETRKDLSQITLPFEATSGT